MTFVDRISIYVVSLYHYCCNIQGYRRHLRILDRSSIRSSELDTRLHHSFLTYATGPAYLFLPTATKYTIENTTTAPYTNMLQFIVSLFGCGDCGKNVMMNASTRKSTEKMLIGSPARPNEN